MTKGTRFRRHPGRSQGRSDIRALVSDWSVSHGVLKADDVAIATPSYRVASAGRLNLVDASTA